MTTRGVRWSKLDLEQARTLYEGGLSFSQVGSKLGFSATYLARRFKAAGIPARPSGRPFTTPSPPVDVNEIVRLREAGESFPAIGAALGIGHDMVRDRYLRATGKPRRTPDRPAGQRRALTWHEV